jgi:hypothetical protein
MPKLIPMIAPGHSGAIAFFDPLSDCQLDALAFALSVEIFVS